jgi:hypothetical protein
MLSFECSTRRHTAGVRRDHLLASEDTSRSTRSVPLRRRCAATSHRTVPPWALRRWPTPAMSHESHDGAAERHSGADEMNDVHHADGRKARPRKHREQAQHAERQETKNIRTNARPPLITRSALKQRFCAPHHRGSNEIRRPGFEPSHGALDAVLSGQALVSAMVSHLAAARAVSIRRIVIVSRIAFPSDLASSVVSHVCPSLSWRAKTRFPLRLLRSVQPLATICLVP